jgi:hypothetical protein
MGGITLHYASKIASLIGYLPGYYASKKWFNGPKISCQYEVYDPTKGGMICLKGLIKVAF